MTSKRISIFAGLWLIVIGVSFYQQVEDDKRYAHKLAYKQAEMFFQHIVLIRQWNAMHGGVYVFVSDKDQPNPDINVADRDIKTETGRELTLFNPTYMTRQLAEMERGKTGILFHTTSLKPIRSENEPDPWEQSALEALKNGLPSYRQLVPIEGKMYYRYMAPLILGPECMMCHANSGRKPGDTYGGISVSIPASGIEGFMNERLNRQIESHLFLTGAGIVALVIGYWLQTKLNRRLNRAKNNLQLAYLDALTLLPNRRYYDAFLRREWKRSSRHRYPLSMIMIDIDYFKLYNDGLGHMEGDQCLKHVARTLRRYFRRSGDLIARYGGEEFCVVAACDSEQVMELAKMLRMAVEMMQLPHPNSPISKYVTISLGVATLLPNEKVECSLLLHQADQALYAAKQAGRNQVVKYQG